MCLSVQTCTGRRTVVVGHDQQVRRRASPAAVRGAPRDTRGLRAVGAPVTQDWDSLVVRNMSRHPRAATSPLVLDPRAPLCPSIAENHDVDERSMCGVCPGSSPGTKLVLCHHCCVLCSPLIIRQLLVPLCRGFCATDVRWPLCLRLKPDHQTLTVPIDATGAAEQQASAAAGATLWAAAAGLGQRERPGPLGVR